MNDKEGGTSVDFATETEYERLQALREILATTDSKSQAWRAAKSELDSIEAAMRERAEARAKVAAAERVKDEDPAHRDTRGRYEKPQDPTKDGDDRWGR